VPLDTHTLEEFCNAEFNSPWEEFSLVSEMGESKHGPGDLRIKTQPPMGIYVPPEKMQIWQSGRSRAKINVIRAKHPGIDLDILKQYKLIYQWIKGYNLPEVFEHINVEHDDLVLHLNNLDKRVASDLTKKGYSVADMKPEHVIISKADTSIIRKIGKTKSDDPAGDQLIYLYNLIKQGKYSVIDYELLLRTPEHEEEVKLSRRHSYLDDQKNRFVATPLPEHLSSMEILGVPYIFGHAESTDGRLWLVGNNARLFDYFLPERWRKTPSIQLYENREVFYTISKDNIHLVWATSRVGEMLYEDEKRYHPKVKEVGINCPFEESAIAYELTSLGIPCVYMRAIYMTGSTKVEESTDIRKYDLYKDILAPEGNQVLRKSHNYITTRGYYNGPDHWVAEQEGPLYMRIDLIKAVEKGLIDKSECLILLEKVKENLRNVNYDGSLLQPDDLLLSVDGKNVIVKDASGAPIVVICNFKLIWKLPE